MDRAQLESWAQAAAAGDRAAMGRVYDALSPHLYGFLVGLTGRRGLAEDLLQQTFLRAIERLAARRPGDVQAWLFTIARNLAIDSVRARKHLTAVPVPDDPDPRPTPAHRVEISELSEQVRCEVARLPESQREVILLRYYAQMPFKQIAELLDCPVNTALTRAHYGLRKLREAMLCET